MRIKMFASLLAGSLVVNAVGAQQDSTKTKVAQTAVSNIVLAVKAPRSVRVVTLYDSATMEPIVGADVIDTVTKNSVKSSQTGSFGLFIPDFVKEAGAVLEITKVGFEPILVIIDPKLIDYPVEISMKRLSLLPTMEVNASYNITRDLGLRDGLATRCGQQLAICIGSATLENSGMKSVGEIVGWSGVSYICTGGNHVFTTGSGRVIGSNEGNEGKRRCTMTMQKAGGGKCAPNVYIDGLGPLPSIATPEGVEEFERKVGGGASVSAIEVFLSDQPMPLRFNGANSCGSVVVWTK